MAAFYTDAAELARILAAMRAAHAKVDRATAARRPPQRYAATEDLVVYCAFGRELVLVPRADMRVAGDRQAHVIRAFYAN